MLVWSCEFPWISIGATFTCVSWMRACHRESEKYSLALRYRGSFQCWIPGKNSEMYWSVWVLSSKFLVVYKVRYFDRSSCELQIHPDEVDEDEEVLMIWDFNVGKVNISLTASQCSVKASVPCTVNSIASMPYLDPRSINCNCSNYQGMILLSSCSAAATATASKLQNLSLCDEENGSEEDEHEDEEEQAADLDLDDDFSETFAQGGRGVRSCLTTKRNSNRWQWHTLMLKLMYLFIMKELNLPVNNSWEKILKVIESIINIIVY